MFVSSSYDEFLLASNAKKKVKIKKLISLSLSGLPHSPLFICFTPPDHTQLFLENLNLKLEIIHE